MEFICLRKNYITIQKNLEAEKEKRKGLELDMVNIQTTNQQLNQDTNIYGT